MTKQEQELLKNILLWEHEKAPELAMLLVKGIDLEDRYWKNSLRFAKRVIPRVINDCQNENNSPIPMDRFLTTAWEGDVKAGGENMKDQALIYILYSLYPDTYQEVETLDVFNLNRNDDQIINDFIEPYRELIIEGIEDFYFSWDFASFPELLRADREICMTAIVQEDSFFMEIAEVLKEDVEFIKELLKKGASIDVLLWVPESIKSNKDFFLDIIKDDLDFILHANFDYSKDIDFITQAIERNRDFISVVSSESLFNLELITVNPNIQNRFPILNGIDSLSEVYHALKGEFPFNLELKFFEEHLHSSHRYSFEITKQIFLGLDINKNYEANRLYTDLLKENKVSLETCLSAVKDNPTLKHNEKMNLLAVFKAFSFIDREKEKLGNEYNIKEFFNPDFFLIRNWLFRYHLMENYIDRFLPLEYNDKNYFFLKKYVPLFLSKEMGIEEFKMMHKDNSVIRRYLNDELSPSEKAMLSPSYMESIAKRHRCSECGKYRDDKRIKSKTGLFLCRSCTDFKKRKPRPDCSELLKDKINKSKIAREFGVSDTAVRKWIKACLDKGR